MLASNDGSWEIVVPQKGQELDLEGRLKSFSPSDIVLKEGKPIDHDPELQEYIEQRWQAYVKGKTAKGDPEPFPGDLVRVSTMPSINSDGKIELHLAQTNYKEHIATNFPKDDYSRNLPYNKNANVLNSIAVLVTADNQLVYSIRGQTATFEGAFSGFGSPLHSPDEIFNGGGSAYLFEQVRDALLKETGMSASKKAKKLHDELFVQLGGIAYMREGFHIPLWVAQTSLEAGEVREVARDITKKIKGSDAPKYLGVGFVPLTEEDYTTFLERPEPVKTVQPIWAYLGLRTFGLDYKIPGITKTRCSELSAG